MAAMTESFLSGGRAVGLEVFEPQKSGKYPAVLVLHGTFGMLAPFRADIVSFAEALVASGISALVPHYFDSTKTSPGRGVIEEIPTHLPAWKKACIDAFALMARDSRFEAAHLGALGFSLGGHLALSLAMAPPPATTVRCVVDFFGPTVNPPLEDKYSSLPPVLIQYGTADRLVLPAESEHLIKELHRAGKKKDRDYFFDSYDGEGHGFKEPALTKSRNAAVEFIKNTL
jgi:dienelactone hydrolase